MPLTTEEQELFDIGKSNLPEWYASDERGNEFLSAAAKIMAAARSIAERWLTKLTLITQASVDVSLEADWLDEHARDRGSSRQTSEVDDVLIDRIRNVPDALTRPALQAALNAMIAASGFAGTIAIEELPHDQAFIGYHASIAGSSPPGSSTFLNIGGGDIKFTPSTSYRFAVPPRRPPKQRAPNRDTPTWKFFWSLGTPMGPFLVKDVVDDSIIYNDPSQVDMTTAGSFVWHIERYNSNGFVRDDLPRNFYGRGYRMSHSPPMAIVVILPYGTDAAFQNAVTEMMRQKKAGGIRVLVERRMIP